MKVSRFYFLSVVMLCAFVTPQLFAQAVLSNQVPAFALPSNDLGAANANELMTVKVWLQVHNSALLDENIAQIYDPGSARYGQFMTLEQVQALHAPDAKEAAAVQKFLQHKGLHVTRVGAQNMFVEATGSVAAMQKAFQVQLHNYKVNGKVVRANNANPTIDDASVGTLVGTVSGLSSVQMKPHNVRPRDPDGKVFQGVAVSPNGVFFEGDCFRGVETHAFSTTSTAAVYKGSRYGADITNLDPPHLPPCGFSPQNMYAAYNLNKLYNAGLDGTGQSVVIVDAYGSTTIAQDLATFSSVYGLPTANLTVLGTPIPPGTDATIQGWMDETTLDVEWAHAIAPKAKIVLIISPTANSDDLAAAITTAVVNGLGNVVSNSYGGPESTNAPSDYSAFEGAMKLAAVAGVAVNFSSADDGDFVVATGLADVSYPASSKLATGIGGVSVFLNSSQKIRFQTGWGTNITRIAGPSATGSIPDIPPITDGFQFGAGGGASRHFSKPSFQKSLPGSNRLVPDIGWVADPYTGVEIIETNLTDSSQFVEVIGGTSVACPMFSGLWAVAAQKHGGPLGQAAPRLYKLSDTAITDVKAVDFGTHVTGAIQDPTGAIKESANQLATPTPQVKTFTSAFYNSPFSTSWFVLTFGTDSSLPVKTGWDEVTGLGTPNGYTFVTDVAK